MQECSEIAQLVEVGAEQLGLDAEQADGGEGGGLGGGEGEEGGGAGDGGDGEGAGGGGHLLEQDQAQGEGREEEGAEHLVRGVLSHLVNDIEIG